ncbi:MAG TPA: ATP-binding protein [Chryseosolibacter sp.]|nr:ATP-binding protein [Chryseosolibacter sp.]
MWKKLLTIYLIFGLSLAILIALSLYAFQRFSAYLKYAEAVDRNHSVLTQLNRLQIELAEVENNQRAFILFEDSSFHLRYGKYADKIRNTFAVIYDLIKSDPAQRKRIQTLNFLIKSHLDHLHSGIMVGYPPTDYRQGLKYLDRCAQLITEMEVAEKKLMKDQLVSRQFYEETTPQNFRIVFVFTLIVFVISFGLLVQQYRDRMGYQQKLEKNIIELNQANSEWEQIAYVASHDLQEPLRKIRTFSDMLQSKYSQKLDPDGRALVSRIDAASSRAQSLMVDIVNYNTVVYTREKLQAVSLDEALSDLLADMKVILADKQASVQHEGLPVIRAYPSQITLLFRSLLENSLKFAKPDDPVKILISCSVVDKKHLPSDHNFSFSNYHKLVFEDNGIGFDNQFADKIFKMFQRLHPQESSYEGRGIGLAMAKRIMTNHTGFITARGRPGKGARFTLYFPVR